MATGAQPSTALHTQLYAQARRVALNRTIAGVHFPVDTAAGHLLGTTLAEYFVHRCKIDGDRGTFTPRTFRGDQFDGEEDFNDQEPLLWPANATAAQQTDPPTMVSPDYPHIWLGKPKPTGAGSPILAWLWNEAKNEWNGKGLSGNRVPT